MKRFVLAVALTGLLSVTVMAGDIPINVMIMSTMLASVALEVVVGAGGAGAGAPLIGTSPARTVIDISPVRATANTKRFMF